jgi:membrane associated rhomboid family serine protease
LPAGFSYNHPAMPSCSYCGCHLPGEETLCKGCFERHYFLATQPKRNLWERIQRFAHVTPVTIALIFLSSAIFLAFACVTRSFWEPAQQQLIAWGADYGPLTTTGQWWRLLTPTFLHAGILHLVFNMQCLSLVGPIAERAFGKAAFLLSYLSTGVIASILSQFFHPNETCVGASGAIFGVVGFLIVPLAFKRLTLSTKQLANPLKSLLAFSG